MSRLTVSHPPPRVSLRVRVRVIEGVHRAPLPQRPPAIPHGREFGQEGRHCKHVSLRHAAQVRKVRERKGRKGTGTEVSSDFQPIPRLTSLSDLRFTSTRQRLPASVCLSIHLSSCL